jgi:hypothetical protein
MSLLLVTLAFAEEPEFNPDKPALKLDLPLFDLPYQIDAANTLEYGFFESYTHPSMSAALNITTDVYSSFHYGMKRFYDGVTMNNFWKKIIYSFGTAAGDVLLYMMPLPTGFIWMHESFHRAVFTRAGIQSHIEYDFPKGAATVPDTDGPLDWADYIRLFSSGIESEFMLVEKLQRNNFFYEQNLYNEIAYWLSTMQSLTYMALPFMLDSDLPFTETITISEDAAPDSMWWVYFLFHPGAPDPDHGIRLSELTDDETQFFRQRALMAYLNLVSPMMIGIQSIPLGRNTGFSGNFALRQHFTSFGTDLTVNLYFKATPFNVAFAYHNNQNYDHVFPAFEVELVDYPVMFNTWGMYISPRIIVGVQPENQDFKTSAAEFFGFASCRVDFAFHKHFLPYLEVMAKTDGWVAGTEHLNGTFGVKLGVSARF